MYAEMQAYSYTVFHNTHTCYEDCQGWHDYYFSGGVEPMFTVPVTTTHVQEPTTTASTASESEVATPPVRETYPIEGSSSIEETGESSISPADAQTTASFPPVPLPMPTPTTGPDGSNGNTTSLYTPTPSSTSSVVPIAAAAAAVNAAYPVLLGLLVSLIAL